MICETIFDAMCSCLKENGDYTFTTVVLDTKWHLKIGLSSTLPQVKKLNHRKIYGKCNKAMSLVLAMPTCLGVICNECEIRSC